MKRFFITLLTLGMVLVISSFVSAEEILLEEVSEETQDYAFEYVYAENTLILDEAITDMDSDPADASAFLWDEIFSEEVAEIPVEYEDPWMEANEITLSYEHSVSFGDVDNDVFAVQQRLYELGYLDVAPDGYFGYYTLAAVEAFQRDNGLVDDGVVGPWTLDILNGSPVPKNAAVSNTEQPSGDNTGDMETLTLSRSLVIGTSGNDVTLLQQRLFALGYLTFTPDGAFGGYTEAAVLEFQKANGLLADGIVGNLTAAVLNANPIAKYPASPSQTETPSEMPSEGAPGVLSLSRNLSIGTSGDDVLSLQKRLAELGYLELTPDGIFGGYTEAAVMEFQAANGLLDDGLVGPLSLSILNGTPIAKEKPQPVSDTATPTDSETATPSAPVKTDEKIILQKGSEDDDVEYLQRRLLQLGYTTQKPTGIFDEETEAAVKVFQQANGLTNTPGTVTQYLLDLIEENPVSKEEAAKYQELQKEKDTKDSSMTEVQVLSLGAEGDEVSALQKELADLGFYTGKVTGTYDDATKKAVIAFQKTNGDPNPDGDADLWVQTKLTVDPVPKTLSISPLATSQYLTDKHYYRSGNTINYIVIHHMAGRLSGANCAQYFQNNGLENSANYCIGYDGDIACNVPENYGAWTSSSGYADRQAITIEVSDVAADDWHIPEAAQNSLVDLCTDLISRYDSLGGAMVYDPSDEDKVMETKTEDGSWEDVQGNILFHKWTSGGTTGCPEWHMIEIMPELAKKVNQKLAVLADSTAE